jgi:hypothetical protein
MSKAARTSSRHLLCPDKVKCNPVVLLVRGPHTALISVIGIAGKERETVQNLVVVRRVHPVVQLLCTKYSKSVRVSSCLTDRLAGSDSGN